MHNNAAEIGETLRQRRELLGLLQPQLAAIAGISTRTIQLIEAGKANPSLDTLYKVADSLGFSIKLLLKEMNKGTATITDPLL